MRATGPRLATRYYGEGSRPVLVPCKIAPGAVIFALTMAALNAQGQLVSAADATAVQPVGRVDVTYNNAGNAAAIDGEYRRGVFNWASDGSLTQANVGKAVDVADDQTVKARAGGKVAGILLFIDRYGYWIESTPELYNALNP